MENVLELKNINQTFYTKLGAIDVLKDINIEVKKGEIISIIGPSGAGKSTILNIISGLLKPTSGSVLVNGELGYMFQKDHLLEWRNIWDNIKIGLEIRNEENEKTLNRIQQLLEKYGLIDFKHNYPYELSGGMRQRIALIRTLAIEPALLLLDEAFSALDYQTRLMVSDDVYKIIKNEGKTAILVTHDIAEAISLSDRIVVFSKRPASVKKIYDIELTNKSTPIHNRKCKEFNTYYDQIWRDLDVHL